ncbi:MAG: ATP-dependent Clp protease ATP-binding subunit [bacterium]|nr:ATP-dependent Clp protease ATP-binding subunit [bacterium]
MDYSALQQEARAYRGALQTEGVISGSRLHTTQKILRVLAVLSGALWGGLFLFEKVPFLVSTFPEGVARFVHFLPLAQSAFFLLLGLWLVPALWYGFFASFYFKDADTILPEFALLPALLRYEVARVATRGYGEPVLDFFGSRFGGAVVARLGLSAEDIISFLKERAVPTVAFELVREEGEPITLPHFAKGLIVYDEGLRTFLASKKIDTTDFVGSALWVSRMEADYKKHLRFWSKDALGRIPGIGKDWAYGEIVHLERYATALTEHRAFASAGTGGFGKHEAEEIERILSRGRESNVLLVGEEGVPKLAPLARLARHISAGTVLPPLEHKIIFVLDGALFVSAMKERVPFEEELRKLLQEASAAGNIILTLDNFEKLFQGAKELGSDILSLLDPFLTSQNIQIVALAELGAFHQTLEPNPKIRERFERVLLEGAGVAGSLPILEDEALRAEMKEGVYFTYPALRAVAESAERYFFEGVMPDKAIDLLLELVPKIKAGGKKVILREDVLELVSRKTGISVSEAKGEERSKLLKLEEVLHERIVGQDEAVSAISGALRRARSGISSPNRPMGSFLFLGPTGVGKTETTKALAQAFFGDEKNIIRLDMSEFQGDDALSRLIGTFESGKAGVLASLLREHPYGVLLLDEFEKTNKEVHDLFLQILDEGFFTDVTGKRVNARNLIIIATSNAASDVIWNMKDEIGGKGKDIVLTEIINRAIFKPELLNRFDGVILFHPLTAENLKIIAKFQLQKLAKRLKEKGLELIITDPLLDFLVSVGQDPKFGARPMNRAIQEKVEQAIAEKMLRGELSAGSKVELSGTDLQ